jgi:hypothetical protein
MATFIDEIHKGFLVVKYHLDEAPSNYRQLKTTPFTFDYMEFYVTTNPHDENEWVCIDEFVCDALYETYEEKIVASLVEDLNDYAIEAGDYEYSASRENW